jgi:hypothetical protein
MAVGMEAPADEEEDEPEAPLDAEAPAPPAVVPALEDGPAEAEARTELFCDWMLEMIEDWLALIAVELPRGAVIVAFGAPVVMFIAALPVTAGTR